MTRQHPADLRRGDHIAMGSAGDRPDDPLGRVKPSRLRSSPQWSRPGTGRMTGRRVRLHLPAAAVALGPAGDRPLCDCGSG
jgi:hypothetical protein